MYYAGLDLGQATDYTALAIIERIAGQNTEPIYHVRHLARFPRGALYPAIVRDTAAIMREAPLAGETALIVDGTGVGKAVVDLFRANDALLVTPVTITCGGNAEIDPATGYWRVPKNDIVGALQVLLQTGRLKFATQLPEAQTLVAELQAFRAKVSLAANDMDAWREGERDDLVLAVGLAVWYANYYGDGPLWWT